MLKAEKSNSVFDLKAFKNRAMHFAFGAAFLAAFAFHYPIVYLVKVSKELGSFCSNISKALRIGFIIHMSKCIIVYLVKVKAFFFQTVSVSFVSIK